MVLPSLSKNQVKLITSLKQKKYRLLHGFFVVEGVKTINELINSNMQLHSLYTTERFLPIDSVGIEREVLISESDLKRISFLTTPNKALAIFKMPIPQPIDANELIVALDAVRDPGNLGTIIRLCDWFGIKDLICSHETVDCFNPKVIQATMGSITRVNINYVDLPSFLKDTHVSVYGTFMDGENVYNKQLPTNGILVLGNEANGISREITELVTERLAIPRFGKIQATESLNVATATAILLSEFRRC